MLNDVLLVTRNYQGTCEENFITTFEELAEKYIAYEDNGYLRDLKAVIVGGDPYEWDATYYLTGSESFDIRTCQGPEDLVDFLSGKFNTNLEEMQDNNPGQDYDFWYWENREDFFTPMAVREVSLVQDNLVNGNSLRNEILKVMPDFPFESVHARLDDVIAQSENQSRGKRDERRVIGDRDSFSMTY